jgi:caffeoyl-CoA O-methyltransferase
MEKLRLRTAQEPKAIMMSAPDEVNFFMMLMKLIGAKNVVEVGVFTGILTSI